MLLLNLFVAIYFQIVFFFLNQLTTDYGLKFFSSCQFQCRNNIEESRRLVYFNMKRICEGRYDMRLDDKVSDTSLYLFETFRCERTVYGGEWSEVKQTKYFRYHFHVWLNFGSMSFYFSPAPTPAFHALCEILQYFRLSSIVDATQRNHMRILFTLYDYNGDYILDKWLCISDLVIFALFFGAQ